MLKFIVATGMALSLMPSLAGAAPFPSARAKAVPLLSGSYIYSENRICPLTLVIHYSTPNNAGGNYADSSSLNSNASNAVEAGTIDFVQGSTKGSGNATLSAATHISGTAFTLHATGNESGTQGQTLAQTTESGTIAFSQTAKILTLQDDGSKSSTYNIYYGKMAGGIAQAATWSGIDDKGCADTGTVILQ
jgi:hypothetical protein